MLPPGELQCRLSFTGEHRHSGDSAGQVIKPTMRVTGGQNRRRVPCQLLGSSKIHARPAQHGQVSVAESVEVGVLRPMGPVHDVGDARLFQIEANHISASVKP
ncbi:MAG: hypothetical protein QM703_25485 [Gemmatales bacterium]